MEKNQEAKKGNSINIFLIIAIILLVCSIAFMVGSILNNNSSSGSSTGSDNKENLLSDDEALKIGKELYEKGYDALHFYGREESLSAENCEKEYNEVLKIFKKDVKIINLGGYYESENDMNFSSLESHFKNEQGAWDCIAAARGGNIEFMAEKELTIEKIEENKISFIKQATYCKDAEYDENDDERQKCLSTVQTMNHKFIIEKEDETWKIAQISSVA